MSTRDSAATNSTRATDPRIERTRAAIVSALHVLLREGRTDLSVRDVVEAANVSRASFYLHFSGVEQVALVLLRETFEQLRTAYVAERRELGQRTDQSVRAGQQRLADAFWEQRALLGPLMESSFCGAAYSDMVRSFARMLESLFNSEPARVPTALDPSITAVALSHLLIGLLTEWVTGRIDAPKEQIIDHMVALLPSWATQPDLPIDNIDGRE